MTRAAKRHETLAALSFALVEQPVEIPRRRIKGQATIKAGNTEAPALSRTRAVEPQAA